MNNQQILKEHYFDEIKELCCTQQAFNSSPKRICACCQKPSAFLTELNGLLMCLICWLKQFPLP